MDLWRFVTPQASHKDWRCIIFDWFWEHAVGFYIIALGLTCCYADECISTDTEGGEAKLLFVSNAELRNALSWWLWGIALAREFLNTFRTWSLCNESSKVQWITFMFSQGPMKYDPEHLFSLLVWKQLSNVTWILHTITLSRLLGLRALPSKTPKAHTDLFVSL